VMKDLLWAAAGMLLTYAINKIQTQFNWSWPNSHKLNSKTLTS
jgi:hypothetical protein